MTSGPITCACAGVIDRLGSPAVMACTATATEQVAEEIVVRLGLRDPLVLRAGFDRPEPVAST